MTTPDELFVFAGAGASFVPPAALPLFLDVRDHILVELDLKKYATSEPADPTPERAVALGLVPEPFLLALDQAGVRVDDWLSDVFASPTPNAVHYVLAELAIQGANVWTVNFDDGIERAARRPLSVLAWPDSPDGPADLVKPHGTVRGRLIATAEQVLRGIEPAWLERLRNDIDGRTAVFIGYRGRDLDFQPHWNDVLGSARRVIWFDRPPVDESSIAERARKELLLREINAGRRLEFPSPAPAPDPALPPNPSWDFVKWAEGEGLVLVPIDLRDQIQKRRGLITLPPLQGTSRLTQAAVREVLGDIAGARRVYLDAVLHGAERRVGFRRLERLTMNHGSRLTSIVLTPSMLLPPLGPLAPVRDGLRRKSLSIAFNLGHHRRVVRRTRRASAECISTILVLRAGSLRMTGNLDEAAEVGAAGFRRALNEHHPVRIANAAFQHTFALMWAGRLDEAEAALEEELRPHAEIAASRWVAWAAFLEAAIHVHRNRPDDALAALDSGLLRFQAEALVDGVVSCQLVQLTVMRLAGTVGKFEGVRTQLQKILSEPKGTYYARGSRFTMEALALENGEFARWHTSQHEDAKRAFKFVAASKHPVHEALANLGLAALAVEGDDSNRAARHIKRAAYVGRLISARLIVACADALSDAAANRLGRRSPEVYFP